jgi:DivIVA domain-containing protein
MIGDDPAGVPRNVPAIAPASPDSAWAIRSLVDRIRFTPVRVREGYDMAEVDDFLDRVVQAAERGEPVGALIEGVELSRVRVREGYDVAEVDGFLQQLKGAGPAPDRRVIPEQRGLLSRFRGRD